jgi:hypothetical protein
MTNALDAIGPELHTFLQGMTPEQHTARVLTELDAWLREKQGNIVEVHGMRDGFIASAVNVDALDNHATVRDTTLIGALANLLQVLQNG